MDRYRGSRSGRRSRLGWGILREILLYGAEVAAARERQPGFGLNRGMVATGRKSNRFEVLIEGTPIALTVPGRGSQK